MKKTSMFFLALIAIACTSSVGQMAQNSLLISPGDNIHISILDMPEMEQDARVTDTGEVPLIGVGEIKVANMTPGDAAIAIHDRLISSHYLNHPQVSVVVDQYATQQVTIIGEVRNPGSYSIATPRLILDVLALGGGLTNIADRDVMVERRGDQRNTIHYNVNNNAEQAINEQILVQPGDTVVVPRAGIVYVLGDVNRPGGYTMNNNESQITLLEALSNAGGAANTAKLKHARLIRKANHSETQISLGDIEKGKQPDISLEPGDILYVPFSYSKNLLITSSAGIVGAAGAAAIYTTR